MLSAYPACFLKEKGSSYSVIFPDLNYLATSGENLSEALSMAIDCLAGYLYTCKQDGEEIPPPSLIQDIDIQEVADDPVDKFEDAFVNIVAVDVEEYAKNHFEKSVKKTLSIPAWLNAAALERNINFSQVLQDALKAQIQQ